MIIIIVILILLICIWINKKGFLQIESSSVSVTWATFYQK